jgi:hypothetical protein
MHKDTKLLEIMLNHQHNEDEKAKKKRKQPPKYPLPDWCKERYLAAHKAYYQTNFPHGWADGHYIKPTMPQYHTANGLTKFIAEYVKWTGGVANRINTMGRKVDGKYIYSTTKTGTADMDVIIKGVNLKFEIKCGSDRPSSDQLKMQAKIRAAGGIYEFIRTPMEFFELYDKVVASRLF